MTTATSAAQPIQTYDPAEPPAQQLVGKTLENGWRVIEKLARTEGATGGHFSVSYAVQGPAKKRAFLKALDYSQALLDPDVDPAEELERLTASYNFERSLHDKCKSSRLSRIAGVLDHGTIRLVAGNQTGVVQYLIFEFAPRGDIRNFLGGRTTLDMSWTLQMMHQSAAALRQLHSIGVAHQDLKPSNVLMFSPTLAKLADLGRAFDRSAPSPHDDCDWAGDRTYAPPELLYRHVPEDWRTRRLGCDLYLLGSLFVFLWAGVSMTHMLLGKLDPRFHYLAWGDTYREVLPYLRRSFSDVISAVHESSPTPIAKDVTLAVSQLCDPDPSRRGHPKNVAAGTNRYSLERYVAMFDRLSTRAALDERLKTRP
jgi:serine/threonine protein kinase